MPEPVQRIPETGASVALKSFFAALLDFAFPPLCHVCGKYFPDADRLHICPSCMELLPAPSSPLCKVCGVPFVGAGDDHTCSSCLKQPPAFDAARAAIVYDGPGRDLIHSFKYDFRTHLRRPLAFLLVRNLSDFVADRRPDLIVPVPLHIKRLRSRGFNQAVLLGELLAREWHIPLQRRAIRRIRWTEPQISLTAEQRRTNVRGAFSVPDDGIVSGKRVLLLDDVITTGSTAEECSRVLKRAKASQVLVITVARAV